MHLICTLEHASLVGQQWHNYRLTHWCRCAWIVAEALELVSWEGKNGMERVVWEGAIEGVPLRLSYKWWKGVKEGGSTLGVSDWCWHCRQKGQSSKHSLSSWMPAGPSPPVKIPHRFGGNRSLGRLWACWHGIAELNWQCWWLQISIGQEPGSKKAAVGVAEMFGDCFLRA